jgi:hypothetical protein
MSEISKELRAHDLAIAYELYVYLEKEEEGELLTPVQFIKSYEYAYNEMLKLLD